MTTPLDQLPLVPEDIRLLKGAKIDTDEDFWARMATDGEFLSKVFSECADRSRVLSQMARVGVDEAIEIFRPSTRTIIPDLLVLGAIVLAGYGLLRDRQNLPPAPVPQVVITKQGGVQPFRVISRDDVALQMRGPETNSASKLEHVIGRYSFRFLSEGSSVLSLYPRARLGNDAP